MKQPLFKIFAKFLFLVPCFAACACAFSFVGCANERIRFSIVTRRAMELDGSVRYVVKRDKRVRGEDSVGSIMGNSSMDKALDNALVSSGAVALVDVVVEEGTDSRTGICRCVVSGYPVYLLPQRH